jgi:hypothetical protein
MRYMRNLLKGLFAGGLALAMVSTLAAQTVQYGLAKVVRVKGSARIVAENGVTQPLKAGTIVKPGMTIQTDQDSGSYVDLVLGEGDENVTLPVVFNPAGPSASGPSAGPGGGSAVEPKAAQSAIRLWSDTAMGLDKFNQKQIGDGNMVTETELNLKRGRISGNVRKLNSQSTFDIKLPDNGIAGIRGTFFDISVTGKVYIKVLRGVVVVAYYPPGQPNNLKTVVIQGGKAWDPISGEPVTMSPQDMKVLTTIATELVSAGHGAKGGTYVINPDHTYEHVSTHGPPFTPPGPPPVIPPGKKK